MEAELDRILAVLARAAFELHQGFTWQAVDLQIGLQTEFGKRQCIRIARQKLGCASSGLRPGSSGMS